MKKGLSCITTILLALSGNSWASEDTDTFSPHPYFGLAYTYVDADYAGYNASNSLLGAILGYRFHENFAVDFRAYGNISDDDVYGVSVEIERSFSVLAKGIMPINDYVYIYGLLGMADSKAKLSYNGVSGSDSDDDIQYGVGMAISKGEGSAPLETQVEWIKLYDEDGLEATGINLNIVYNF